MVKNKDQSFNNKEIAFIALVVGLLLPFMYYIGAPWISEMNEQRQYENRMTEECFIQYATEYCLEYNMTFSSTNPSWGYFWCKNDKSMRETNSNPRFYYTKEELNECKYDVFEVNDDE